MKTVLITGATGAIGSALVPLFLREQGTAVRLIVRADSAAHLRERMDRLFAFWELDAKDFVESGRVQALRGDVSEPLLGLEETAYRRLSREVTHLIHAAGNVKLNQPLAEARKSAVASVKEVAALANACRTNGPFHKLDVVSTVGVAGRSRGLVPEEPLPASRRFHNTYEAAKAEAESWLLDAMRAGLPTTVHRPSMVVGDSQTGKVIHFQVFYFLSEFLSGARTWGVIPETGKVRLDIIPVDYVARAIHVASGRDDAVGRVFHLCSGPGSALPVSEITPRIRAVLQGLGANLPRLRKLRPLWVRTVLPLLGLVAPLKLRRALKNLPFFLAYLDEDQVFENCRSDAFFAAAGVRIPAVDQYLEKVLKYYYAMKKSARPQAQPVALGV